MSGQDPNDLSDRIARAQEKHAAEEAKKARREAQNDGSISAAAHALRYGAEFGASVFVGIMFGLLIDHFFGTEPWGLLAMLGFGLAAGILNVIRAYRQMTANVKLQGTGQTNGPEDGKQG
jgi:ATP synthase protein I